MSDRSVAASARRARRLLEEIKAFLIAPGSWKFAYGDLSKNSPLRRHVDKDSANGDLAGITLPAIEMILIDYRHDVLSTLIHECLHALRPHWTETGVRRAEKMIIRHLTSYEAARLHCLLGDLLSPR